MSSTKARVVALVAALAGVVFFWRRKQQPDTPAEEF
jgi:hypothetical protein